MRNLVLAALLLFALAWPAAVDAQVVAISADPIAVTGNPLADVRLLESLEFVMNGGAAVKEGK